MRLSLYGWGVLKQKKFQARIISVGNITVGGTGKTPLVIYLAEKLKERNEKVAILSRGYRRKRKEMVELSHKSVERFNWQEVGDEPYLMARRLSDVPILVTKHRKISGRYAIEKYGVQFLILDDGFQHLKLFRDLDILVIDSTHPFDNGKLLPAGGLREPLSSLKRADVLVLTKTDQAENKEELIRVLRNYNPQAPIVESIYGIHSIERLWEKTHIDTEDMEEKKVLAFSGIGNPFSFENSLDQLRVRILRHRIFPDHFPYSRKDILGLEEDAKSLGADFLITTEKDSVRIPLINQLEIPILVLKITLRITGGEKSLLDKIGRESGWS